MHATGQAKRQRASGDLRRGMDDVLWLTRWDIARSWSGYLISAAYLALLSFLLVGSDARLGDPTVDFVMIAMAMILATPFFAREYMSWSTDPIAERLAWLRTLPIGVPTIVRSRMISVLVATPLNVLALFLPIALADTWELAPGDFLWLVVATIGIALAGAGATLFLEMSLTLRRWLVLNSISAVALIVAVLVLAIAFDVHLFESLARAVEWNGPLVAAICIAIGGAALLGLEGMAEDGLERREFRR